LQDNYAQWLWMHKADDGVTDATSEPFQSRGDCIVSAAEAFPGEEIIADGVTVGAHEYRVPLPEVTPDPALVPDVAP
jgi:hypothetical protein